MPEALTPSSRTTRDWLVFAGVVVLIATYHFIQSLGRVTPWIIGDEIGYAQLARGVAETGSAEFAGDRRRIGALQSYLLAPAWFIEDVGAAWAVERLITVVGFCLTAIPVYMLARRFVPSKIATLTAAAAILLPIAFYGSTMMQEPFALPLTITVALLTTRLIEGFRWWVVIALAIAFVAGLGLRGQLVILPLAVAIALLTHVTVRWLQRIDADLRLLWVGCAILMLGVLSSRQNLGAGLLSAGLDGLRAEPGKFFDVILHSAGATTIGMAVIPAVALGAATSLVGAKDTSRAAFAATTIGFLVTFLAYAGLKSSSQSFVTVTLVEERNLIYLEPLGLVALCMVIGARLRWIVLSAAVAAALVVHLPIVHVGSSPILSENPGMSWVWHLRRRLDVSEPLLTVLLFAVLGLAVVLLRTRSGLVPALGVTATLAFTAGLMAYRGDHQFSKGLAAAWLRPDHSWVDAATDGQSTALVVSDDIPDPNGLFLLQFWNRSINRTVVLSGVRAHGGVGVPTVLEAGAPITGASFALHTDALLFAGPTIRPAESPQFGLTDISRGDTALAEIRGISPDRWAGTQFTVRRLVRGAAGKVRIEVVTAQGFLDKPRTIVVSGVPSPPRFTIPRGVSMAIDVRVPAGLWTLTFDVAPTNSPGPQDPRQLSLQVGAISVPH